MIHTAEKKGYVELIEIWEASVRATHNFLLGISNPKHVMSHPMRGLLFENFIISEFLKNRYNHVKNKNIYFFRDHVGNEVDIILDYGTYLYPTSFKMRVLQ